MRGLELEGGSSLGGGFLGERFFFGFLIGRSTGNGQQNFLLVLICPTWPQFAHFRWVPVPFVTVAVPGDAGEAGDPSVPST